MTNDDGNDQQTEFENMQVTLQVLSKQIEAQNDIVQSFENEPQAFFVATTMAEALNVTYNRLKLEAALLRIEIILGAQEHVANVVTQLADDIEKSIGTRIADGNSQSD